MRGGPKGAKRPLERPPHGRGRTQPWVHGYEPDSKKSRTANDAANPQLTAETTRKTPMGMRDAMPEAMAPPKQARLSLENAPFKKYENAPMSVPLFAGDGSLSKNGMAAAETTASSQK